MFMSVLQLLLTGVCLITHFADLSLGIPVHEKFQIFDSQGFHFSYQTV